MSRVQVYDRPEPSESYKKKKFLAYSVAGLVVVLVTALIWGSYFNDAPKFDSGEDSMGEQDATEMANPARGVTPAPATTPGSEVTP